jgi:hypothetical protein
MDISRRDLINKLESQYNFQLENPTLVISEGISHYLTINDLKKLLIDFSSPQRQNSFLMEYLVPLEHVKPVRREISEEIFKLITTCCNLPLTSRYSYDELDGLFKAVWGKITEHYNLQAMEYLRTRTNKYFNSGEDGWVECVLGKI